MQIFGKIQELIYAFFRGAGTNPTAPTTPDINVYADADTYVIQGAGTTTGREVAIDPSGATDDTKTTIVAAQTADRSITLPDATDTLVGKDTADILTNKSIGGDTNTLTDIPFDSIKTEAGSPNTFISRDGAGIIIDTKAVPTGAVVGETDGQTLTNKTIDADNNTITNLVHGAEVDNPSSGVHGVSGAVVGTTDSQTLTNKTLTTPIVNTPIINTGTLNGLLSDENTDNTVTATFVAPSATTINFSTIGTATLANLTGGSAGAIKLIKNTSGSTITLANANGGAGQIITGTGGNISLLNGATTLFTRDSVADTWYISGTFTTAAITSSLDALADVIVPTPISGEVLSYDGANWINSSVSGGDTSFKIHEIIDPNMTVLGGEIILDDGRELATYDGTGLLASDFGGNLTVDIDAALIIENLPLTSSEDAVFANPNPGDGFGTSVSVDGIWAAVGILGNGTGGEVYVYENVAGTWTFRQTLTGSGTGSNDYFGYEVSLRGDVLAVGAERAPTSNTGEVYIFRESGGTWAEEAGPLVAADSTSSDFFGSGVSIDGDWLAVGARGDDTPANSAGAIYIFEHLGGGVWNESQKLTPASISNQLGNRKTLALRGDLLLVGNPKFNANTGEAYIYRESGGTWGLEDTIAPSDPVSGDLFGSSVGINNTTLIISSPSNDDPVNSGSAYIFNESVGSWTETQKLTASDATTNDLFGESVAISDNNVVVIGAQAAEDSGSAAGAYYVFELDGTWLERDIQTASDAAVGEEYGDHIDISSDGSTVIVSAPTANSNVGAFYLNTLAAIKPNGSWYSYLDIDSTGAVLTQSDTGRKVVPVESSNIVMSQNIPDDSTTIDLSRYIPLGFCQQVAGVWSSSDLGSTATRTHSTVSGRSSTTKVVDASFTGGETVYFDRVGDIVTITWETMAHTPGTNASTSGTWIPEGYRPTNIKNIGLGVSGGKLHSLEITSIGGLTIRHYDSSLVLVSDSSLIGGSISYNVNV